jgi:hypothetical protein
MTAIAERTFGEQAMTVPYQPESLITLYRKPRSWSVDRLGRSLQDLVAFLSEIHAKKVDLYPHQQGMDTTTPAERRCFR